VYPKDNLLDDYFRYSSTMPFAPLSDILPINPANNQTFGTSLAAFTLVNKARYTFSKFAIVAKDKTVRDNAVNYF